ncbi:hypothetical protein CLOM_g3059 [Closterium sp. NIES-68]|nr:hypothetical protein CLOM_g3059 [Closterium sp. NIES-68]
MIDSFDWLDRAACCSKCAENSDCTFWQLVPGYPADEREPASPDICKLYAGTPNCRKFFPGGAGIGAGCRSSVTNDPHLVGAHGTRYDFNGRPDRTFCLLTDRDVHVNMLLRGYYSEDTTDAALVVDGKAVHTWIKELGIVWFANGATHTARLVARNGKQQLRGDGFMKAIEIDGQKQPRMKVGDQIVPSNGSALTISFQALEKEGPYDVDHYTLLIDRLLSIDVKLRVAHPKLQTPTDAEVHINMGWRNLRTPILFTVCWGRLTARTTRKGLQTSRSW